MSSNEYKNSAGEGSKDEAGAMGQHPRSKRRDSQKKKKRETGHYLTYYQSAIADGRAEESSDSDKSRFLVRQESAEDSASSSDYSSEDSRSTPSKTTGFSTTTHYLYPDVNPLPAGTRLRAANASEGGSDRRRMAIVEMDAASGQSSPEIPSSIQSEETSSLRSRRGLKPNLAGLALVAPPDAAPKTYSHLTPPTTGPHTTDAITREISSRMPESPRVLQKKRSTREQNSAPRGRGVTSPKSSGPRVMLSNNEHATPRINYPISRRSRSPSPSSSPSKSTSERPGPSHARRHEQDGNSLLPQQHDRHRVATPKSSRQSLQQLTPEIGQYKDIATRVAAPVVISLDSAAPLRRKDNSTSNQSSRRSSPPGVRSASSAHFPPSSKDRSPMPGLHNTAGPPPPPPRAVFSIDASMPAPPRPPRLHSPNPPRARDIENLKAALQLPPSVTAALASKSPKTNSTPPPPSTVVEQDDKQRSSHSSLNHSKSIHRREGAFSPSGSNASEETDPMLPTENPRNSTLPPPQSSSIENATITSPTAPDSISTEGSVADESEDIVPPMVTVRPLRFSDEQTQTPLKKDDGLTDVTNANDLDLTPSRKRRTYNGSGSSSDYSNSSTSPTRRSSRHGSTNSMTTDTPNSKTPSPPPKIGLMRTSLSLSLKRFSGALPRTPTSSVSSKSIRRTSTSSTHYSSRTPSPSLQSYEPSRYQDVPPPFKKIRSQHPPAMFCAEVFSRKTSVERCLLYAQKINELYVHDSGLEDWTFETRIRATTNRPSVGPASLGPQPRHSSRNSIISEATFPIRSDAYTATDITTKEDDIAPASPINLPYPSLAPQNLQPLKSSSSVGHGSGTPPSSIRSLTSNPSVKSVGFFSAIGRKASMSVHKKDKPLLLPTTPILAASKLTKSAPAPVTKPISIPAAVPAIPGGPRAIPGSRPMRSKTLMIHTTSSEREGVARRPSLADVHHSPVGPVLDISPDPEFVHQVDKLAHLLPDADRDVLAGYLRRAGQDMLAIGQYLADEKNGTLKRY